MKNFQQLLEGSYGLNKKLADVNHFCSAILPLVEPNFIPQESVVPALGGKCRWVVKRYLHFKAGGQVRRVAVELWSYWGLSEKVIFSTHPVSQRQPSLAHTDMVYQALEDLTSFLLEESGFKARTKALVTESAAILALRLAAE